MGNGKKAANAKPPSEEANGPQDFVVVIAYTSEDGEVEEDFGRFIQDVKALYTFKQNVRAYAVVDQAAKNVLAKVEKTDTKPSGRGVLVISYDLPAETDEAYARISRTADTVRDLFKDEEDVKVSIAVREAADEVLSNFERL